MSVISASSAGVKDMADGSLRITFEFEPRHAADAFALFGPRGRAVAIAALKDGHGAVVDEQPETGNPVTPNVGNSDIEKPRERLGDLAWRAVQWCKEPEFADFITAKFYDLHPSGLPGTPVVNPNGSSEEFCKFAVQALCGIESRKELDANEDAKRLFNQLIRGPYQKHLMARGIK